ncbi:MAG: aspartate kinase [Candidatus Kapabacteria bacterium]|nr:aspartate kinase [Candidatus Kapabacteria bacterium]
MLVLKFGGTSVATADALRAVASIIDDRRAEIGGVIVVLSATAGTTTQLLDVTRQAGSGESYRTALDDLLDRHRRIATELLGSAACIENLCDACSEYADAIASLGEWNTATLDGMAAFGELFSSTILQCLLAQRGASSTLVDARELIVTEVDTPTVDTEATTKKCLERLTPLLQTGNAIVTQGFIAADADGRTVTLGRGGSDYSAAIIGASVAAREILIYTDVSGVYSADPRVVRDARPLPSISFEQMKEMAQYGAKVLHPETITPAVRASIPVRVLNTFSPGDEGTCVTSTATTTSDSCAVSILRSVTLITGDAELSDHIRAQRALRPHIVMSHGTFHRSMTAVLCSDEMVSRHVEIALLHHKHQQRRASMVMVTGCEAERAHTARLIAAELETMTGRALILPMSASCIAAVVDPHDADHCARVLHAAVTRRPDQV